jgi:hypothetical protein
MQREVGEQGVDGGESVVAGLRCVVAVVFEVIEEGGDERRVEIVDVEATGRGAGLLGGEGEQQPEGEPVGVDGVRAGGALPDQAVGEVGL